MIRPGFINQSNLKGKIMKINAQRMWNRLQRIEGIGADSQGGISRFAWTPEYRIACEELIKLMERIGLTIRMDTVGNIFGSLAGKKKGPAILTGSHLDTVPRGGKFDGNAGVMVALEVLAWDSLRKNGQLPLSRCVEYKWYHADWDDIFTQFKRGQMFY